jgi:hypothetical protein
MQHHVNRRDRPREVPGHSVCFSEQVISEQSTTITTGETMKLFALFGYDRNHIRDDLVPELLLVRSEFQIEDGDPEKYDVAVEEAKDGAGVGMEFISVELIVDEQELKSRMRPLRMSAKVASRTGGG